MALDDFLERHGLKPHFPRYPADFSERLRAPVETAYADAERAFVQARKNGHSLVEGAIDLVKPVVIAFAHQACESGLEGRWTTERIRTEVRRFQETLIHFAYYKKSESHQSTRGFDSFQRQIETRIEQSQEWLDHLTELSAVAKHQADRSHSAFVRAEGASDRRAQPIARAARKGRDRGRAGRQYESGKSGTQTKKTRTSSGSLPKRAAWLKAEMENRGHITPYRLHKAGGPDKKTIAKILRGKPVSDEVLRKLVAGLSHEGDPLNFENIPRD
jgi:hypothetical protein